MTVTNAPESAPAPEERILRRIRRTAIALAAIGAGAAGALRGGAAALSLTAAAGLVIFSFYFLERITAKILVPRIGMRLSDFMVPAVGFLAVAAILLAMLRWKRFDLLAGVIGFSVVVLAIGVEALRGFGRT